MSHKGPKPLVTDLAVLTVGVEGVDGLEGHRGHEESGEAAAAQENLATKGNRVPLLRDLQKSIRLGNLHQTGVEQGGNEPNSIGGVAPGWGSDSPEHVGVSTQGGEGNLRGALELDSSKDRGRRRAGRHHVVVVVGEVERVLN